MKKESIFQFLYIVFTFLLKNLLIKISQNRKYIKKIFTEFNY